MTDTLRKLCPPAALAMVALIGAGCSNAASENGSTATGGGTKAADEGRALKFAGCMRENGVDAFPDPDASGELTIDEIANGSSLDTSTPAFERAISACKDLEPPGFMGRKRSGQQQEMALEFAQCMRDHGIEDFPDPIKDGPLVDTNRIPSAAGRGARSIPGFQAAMETCSDAFSGELGLGSR